MEWKNFGESEKIGCDTCTKILGSLNEHKNGIKYNLLEGQMRSKDITTLNYHLNNHLVNNGMAKVENRGAIKKERFVIITDKGKSGLSETLKRE